MNFLSRILLVLMLAFSTPTLAQQCVTTLSVIEQTVQKYPDIHLEKLSEADTKTLIETFGGPPALFDSFYLLSKDDTVQIIVVKSGCVTFQTNSFPIQLINRTLGRKDAASQP